MTEDLYFRGKGMLVGAAFFVIGTAIVLLVTEQWIRGMKSHHWIEIEAVMVSAGERSEVARGAEGQSYEVRGLDFLYRYEVGGREYLGNGISYGKKGVDVADLPAFLSKHPEGSTLTVYYNPDRPGEAVMERGVPAAGILFVLMPGVFVLLGPLIVWGSWNGAIARYCKSRGWRYG